MNCLNVLFIYVIHCTEQKFHIVTIYTVDRKKILLSCTHMTTYMRKALETL